MGKVIKPIVGDEACQEYMEKERQRCLGEDNQIIEVAKKIEAEGKFTEDVSKDDPYVIDSIKQREDERCHLIAYCLKRGNLNGAGQTIRDFLRKAYNSPEDKKPGTGVIDTWMFRYYLTMGTGCLPENPTRAEQLIMDYLDLKLGKQWRNNY